MPRRRRTGMSEAAGPTLTPAGEAAWLRLCLHLEWCESFELVMLFSSQAQVAHVLRDRLAALYRARITGLEVQLPQAAAELFHDLLPRLRHPPAYQRALSAPIRLDLTRPPAGAAPDGAAWQEARLQRCRMGKAQRAHPGRHLSCRWMGTLRFAHPTDRVRSGPAAKTFTIAARGNQGDAGAGPAAQSPTSTVWTALHSPLASSSSHQHIR